MDAAFHTGGIMKPRITFNLKADGDFEIWINEEGRDLLVQELQGLNKGNEHFHLGPDEDDEVQVSTRPYRADDKILEYGKVLFRPDEWDKQYFPHVFDTKSD
ncbi:MAG: hypothetical protein WBQ86_12950 [Candidatus Binatus sp.]